MDVRKRQIEARIPLLRAFRCLSIQARCVDNFRAEAGRTNARAVSTGQTSRGYVVPMRMFEALLQSRGQTIRFEVPTHRSSRFRGHLK